MKSARKKLDILSAYRELGSYRAVAAFCGTTHRTVCRVVERHGRPPIERPPRPKTTDSLAALFADRVRATDGRISAKRLLPAARAAGYTGSARNLRRAVAITKATWRTERRVYRPWQPVPGEHLAIDWGTEGGLHVFCASRARPVRRFALTRQPPSGVPRPSLTGSGHHSRPSAAHQGPSGPRQAVRPPASVDPGLE